MKVSGDSAEIRRLVHELQAHQVELEARNTELESTREALQATLERYVELYELLPAGYLTLDGRGRIIELNLYAARLLGCERGALVGARLGRLLDEPARDNLARCLHRAVHQNVESQAEIELKDAAGGSRWLSLESVPDRKRGGCRLVLLDITARKVAEAAVRRADRRKTEFLAMLGHELRNPLVPIRNAAHVLRRRANEDAQLDWAGEVIERQVVHLTRIVDDLLDVSRMVQGQIRVELAPLRLDEVVARALETARLFVDAKGQRLTVRLPPEPLRVQGDAVRLTQVVVNVLANASKYSDRDAAIELSVTPLGGEVELRVTDEGSGIDSALLPYVFDLFTQGERTLERAEGGLGIGLTLVRHVVALHGGRVEAESGGRGHGTTIRIRLPREGGV